jgi:hypothetical protein
MLFGRFVFANFGEGFSFDFKEKNCHSISLCQPFVWFVGLSCGFDGCVVLSSFKYASPAVLE